MRSTFDLSAIMRDAHRAARKAAGNGAYRAVFAKALLREWRIAREGAARFEQNTGRPVGSCLADLPTPAPAAVHHPAARPAFAQFGSARLFFGPGAYEAAVADVANRGTVSFTRSRAAGRRVAWVA